MKKNDNQIILCQPDSKKGCSACCGLLNLRDISKKYLSGFLNSFEERRNISGRSNCFWNQWTGYNEIRSDMAHICPYQGFIRKGKPGCMYHPLVSGKCMRSKSLFGTRVCNAYLCPAHDILDYEYKQILIKYINDWYLYTISVVDPDSFVWIVDRLKDYSEEDLLDIRGADLKLFRKALYEAIRCHSRFLNKTEISVFQFSISEYNAIKRYFSLGSKRKEISAHKKDIINRMKELLEYG